jgi:hypothetical protein
MTRKRVLLCKDDGDEPPDPLLTSFFELKLSGMERIGSPLSPHD